MKARTSQEAFRIVQLPARHGEVGLAAFGVEGSGFQVVAPRALGLRFWAEGFIKRLQAYGLGFRDWG